MENKMNLVEILKDCPKGMELDCTISNDVVFEKIEFGSTRYPVVVRKLDTGISIFLTKYGQYVDDKGYKCVIFPKGKTTWEGFRRPFKDGDVITCTNSCCTFVSIFKKRKDENVFVRYCAFILDDNELKANTAWSDFSNPRFATEEEKEELFKAIKDNGYKWNAETKTLEKLIQYPQTFEECCTVLGLTELGIIGGYRHGLLTQFRNLLICRDAYWKIAGDWKPDWLNAAQDKYVIFTHNNAICSNRYVLGHNILAFPTEEMRDAFYENFKEPINECISLL